MEKINKKMIEKNQIVYVRSVHDAHFVITPQHFTRPHCTPWAHGIEAIQNATRQSNV